MKKKRAQKSAVKRSSKKPAKRVASKRANVKRKKASRSVAKTQRKKAVKRSPASKRAVVKRTHDDSASFIELKEKIASHTRPFMPPVHFEEPQESSDRLTVVAPVIDETIGEEELEGKDLANRHKLFIMHVSAAVLMVALMFMWVHSIRAHIATTFSDEQLLDPYVENIKNNLESIKQVGTDTLEEINTPATNSDSAHDSYKQEITNKLEEALKFKHDETQAELTGGAEELTE